MIIGAVIRVMVAGKAVPAHLNPSSTTNLLSIDWFRSNLTQFDCENEDCGVLPFIGLGFDTFLTFEVRKIAEEQCCILGAPFFAMASPIVIDGRSACLLNKPHSDEAFQLPEVRAAFLKNNHKPPMPCELWCMLNYHQTPGTFIPIGFPPMSNDSRMIPGAWINDAFNGLPPDASHDLYSGLYT